ncbi:MAG: DUF2256 and DUF3253 domain-containing protein [Pseudobacteriovorax sp.]|nr:DUF2256 and DUF3253 domain-containing protein [Pseudobacteriovorax sp.]
MPLNREKICQTCGRKFSWRKKWERNWEHIRYCSQACQNKKPSTRDSDIERAILELSQARWMDQEKTCCPSEIAQRLYPDNWRAQMERVRQAARRLAHQQKIDILQHGKQVDPSDIKGPIRIRYYP